MPDVGWAESVFTLMTESGARIGKMRTVDGDGRYTKAIICLEGHDEIAEVWRLVEALEAKWDTPPCPHEKVQGQSVLVPQRERYNKRRREWREEWRCEECRQLMPAPTRALAAR